jgi:rhomboid protease GluP
MRASQSDELTFPRPKPAGNAICLPVSRFSPRLAPAICAALIIVDHAGLLTFRVPFWHHRFAMHRTSPPVTMAFRLRVIFLPCLLIGGGFGVIYSLLHWLLLTLVEAPVVSDVVVNLLLPLALPWFPILLWMRHRIRLLTWRRENDPFVGYMLVWLVIAIPTISVQMLIEDVTGTMTRLERIEALPDRHATRYYTVKQFALDKARARGRVHTSVSGRNSENWNVGIYYVVPFAPSAGTRGRTDAFMGYRYKENFRNSLSAEDKRAALERFVRQTEQDFAAEDFKWISYFDTIRTDDERSGFGAALREGFSRSLADVPPILRPRREAFESRTEGRLAWPVGFSLGGIVVWLLAALLVKANPEELARWHEERGASSNADLGELLSGLRPRAGFIVTPNLLIVLLLVWLAMAFRGLAIVGASADDLLAWGAVHGRALPDGEAWRFVTSLFVHASILHLFNNLLALVLVGLYVEEMFGSWWFGVVYLLTGLIGALAAVNWNPNIVLVGASGSVFGVAGFGLALVLTKRKRFAASRAFVLKWAGTWLAINLLLGLILPGVSFVAHVVGFLGGALIGGAATFVVRDRD